MRKTPRRLRGATAKQAIRDTAGNQLDATDPVVARQRIFHDSRRPSRLLLTVVD